MSQTSALTTFLESIDLVTSFEVQGDVLVARTTAAATLRQLSYSFADLTIIDERLPNLVMILAELNNRDTQGVMPNIVYAHKLKDTIKLWITPQTLTTTTGETVSYRWLVEFGVVSFAQPHPNVSVLVWAYQVERFTREHGTDLVVVIDTSPLECPVCPDWLDAEYPGWSTRYQHASSLEYTRHALLEMTLSKTAPTTHVDMNCLRFSQT